MLLVGAGEIIGANARYLISRWATKRVIESFPWGTWIISMSGAFSLGVFTGWAQQRVNFSHDLELFFSIGLLRYYATFAAYEMESLLLMKEAKWKLAAVHLVGMNTACLICVFVGLTIGDAVANYI